MGLQLKSFPRHKQWMVDQDYTNKLTKEEKEWLGRFNQEYYRNRFSNDGKDLHNTPELRRKCYNTENARNRDLFGIKQCSGTLSQSEILTDGEGNEIELLNTIADYDLDLMKIANGF